MHESVVTGRGGFAKTVEVNDVHFHGATATVTIQTDGLYVKAGQIVTVPAGEIQAR